MGRIQKFPAGINRNKSVTVDSYVIYDPDDKWKHNPVKIPIKMDRIDGVTKFSCDDRSRNIHVENESIDEVLVAVDNIIKGRSDIIWTPKLAIAMKSIVIGAPKDKNKIIDLDFDLEVNAIDHGIDSAGKQWERKQGSNFIHSARKRKGFEPTWNDDPQDILRDRDESHILIDDTPENRLAVKNLAVGFKEFLKKVYDLLEPDQIEITVKKLFASSAFLLPEGKTHGKKK